MQKLVQNKISLFIGLFLMAALSAAAQVKYVATPNVGTIQVTSWGFGKNRAISSADAIGAAINSLLFMGVPGSQYEQPLVSDDNKKKHPAVQGLLNGDYAQFVIESTLQREEALTKKTDGVKGKSALYQITLNADALRRYLETKGVIRKFGI